MDTNQNKNDEQKMKFSERNLSLNVSDKRAKGKEMFWKVISAKVPNFVILKSNYCVSCVVSSLGACM